MLFKPLNLQTLLSESLKPCQENLILDLKKGSILLNERKKENLSSITIEKLNVQKAAMYYQVLSMFKQHIIKRSILHYIERFFTQVCTSKSFFNLDIFYLLKVFASSELQITSELEVYNAACAWVDYNYEERYKFAVDILLKIRIPLLPEGVYKNIQNTSAESSLLSSVGKNKESTTVIKKILNDRNKFYKTKSIFYRTNRYNSQEMFNFLIFVESPGDSIKPVLSIHYLDSKNLKTFKQVPTINEVFNYHYDSTYANGEIYAVGANEKFSYDICVAKFSNKTNTWTKVGEISISCMFERLCVLMDKIYFIGGWNEDLDYVNAECFALDINKYEWTSTNEIAKMKKPRSELACAVFQGRVIACGGIDDDRRKMNSVEAYDHGSNSWSYMPNMVERRHEHSLITLKNKMFVIGGNMISCEVYDTCSETFMLLKQPPKSLKFDFLKSIPDTATTIGSKVVIFGSHSETFAYYDDDKNKWAEEPFEFTKDLWVLRKIPHL